MKTAADVAMEAGRLINRMAKLNPKVMHKGPVDIVTEADIEAENLIMKRLRDEYPGHEILAEESGGNLSGEYLWVIDPIDGTTNYSHGYPSYAVSIALLIDKKAVVGAVYEPNLNELFTAVSGRGALLNQKKISVSSVSDLDQALLATGFPYSLRDEPGPIIADFTKILLACQGVRRAGAATLDICNLACGRFDAFWERGLKPWDTAAATLILAEAGGLMTRFDGSPFDNFVPQIVASNGALHDKMMQFFENA